ncbi:MAG: serine/threonine-protein kinase [Phycisphaerales bacterium]
MTDHSKRSNNEDAPWPDAWPTEEDALAEAIGVHARRRLAHGETVSLREYLTKIPGLAGKPTALDIAIESALLSAVGGAGGRRDIERAGRLLAAEYPELQRPILEAATLSALMCSTGALRERIHSDALPTPPCDFGPQFTKAERRFRLVGLLGMGAHGAVYLAIDRALSQPDRPAQVAIKVTLAENDEESFAGRRIAEEGAKARRVDHANVVKVYDTGATEEGLSYIVSEYVAGGSLRRGQRAVRPPVVVHDAVRLTALIADGLQALHTAGLIHFDLKPDNVLLTEGGQPKISDLSLAIRESEKLMSQSGLDPTAGTIGFMAPEQLRGEADKLDSRCDIYALGGILYWQLTGEFPNKAALTQGWGYDEHKAMLTHERALGHVPGDIRAILLRALAPNPDDRYATAAQVAEDLRLFLERRPIRWTKPSTGRVLGLWIRRRPVVAAASGVAALAAAVGGSALYYLDHRATENAAEARIAAAELEAETRWKAQAGKFLENFTGRWASLLEQGVVGESFAALWATEYLLGSGFLNNLEDERATRLERLALLEVIYRDSVETDGAEAVESLVYGSAAAFWALRLDQPDTAGRIVQELRTAWADRLEPGDRWGVVLDVLAFVASGQSGASAYDKSTHERLHASLEGFPDASPLRELLETYSASAAPSAQR